VEDKDDGSGWGRGKEEDVGKTGLGTMKALSIVSLLLAKLGDFLVPGNDVFFIEI